MCDVKKYSDIYKEIAKLNPKDTLQLVLESETEEEKVLKEMGYNTRTFRCDKNLSAIGVNV